MDKVIKFCKQNLGIIILAIIALIVAIAAICAYSAPYPTHDPSDRADAVAKCKSMGGVYGNNGCYVNGVLQK